jgi:hypothetical protein
MTAAIWVLFAVLLSLWTGAVWLATQLMQWASRALEDGTPVGAADLPAMISQAPQWLAGWIPSDVLPAVLASVQWGAQLLETSLPWAGAALGWLIPIAWVGWFLVAAVLTAAAFLVHVIVRRSRAHILPRGV